METKMIFAGFGGQGVLSMGMMYAYGAMHEDKFSTFMPSYGPEMRGGTANCHVVVSDEEVASPLISCPDILVAMNKPSLDKFEQKVKSGGIIFINEDVCDMTVSRTDVKVISLKVLTKAIEMGNQKVANTVMLGAIQKEIAILKDENLLKGLDYLLSSKQKLIALNHDAFLAGKTL